VRHSGPELVEQHERAGESDIADEVADSVDSQRSGAEVWDALAALGERHRKVAWEYVALARPRAEVAAELGVTPARVSQMAKQALGILRDKLEERG
jgi:RNA polymerase sigma factor (sigma-70 family)